MEDVLEVYQLPYDTDFPLVCMDESSKQLVGEDGSAHPHGARPRAHRRP